ncbi:chromate reductase [Oxalobacteraceae bacterium GrIS 1.11]
MKILAISGSLRAASHNSALLRACARIAAPEIAITVFSGIGALPLFNPDLEAEEPASVAELRLAILGADALLIASPEYAHGVSGVIKNTLDWMVGNESFIAKPVALLNASPRATLAHAALRETLLTMSARVIDAASITVPMLGSGMSEHDIVEHPTIRAALQAVLRCLRAAAEPPLQQ